MTESLQASLQEAPVRDAEEEAPTSPVALPAAGVGKAAPSCASAAVRGACCQPARPADPCTVLPLGRVTCAAPGCGRGLDGLFSPQRSIPLFRDQGSGMLAGPREWEQSYSGCDVLLESGLRA